MPKIVSIKLICEHYNNLLAIHFEIDKIYELIAQNILLADFLP